METRIVMSGDWYVLESRSVIMPWWTPEYMDKEKEVVQSVKNSRHGVVVKNLKHVSKGAMVRIKGDWWVVCKHRNNTRFDRLMYKLGFASFSDGTLIKQCVKDNDKFLFV